jgi:hypothetical protein
MNSIIADVVRLTAKSDKTVAELAKKLAVPRKGIVSAVRAAKKQGYSIELAGGYVGRPPSRPLPSETSLSILPPGETRRFAVASDIHVGSKYFLKDQFQDFITRVYKAGTRVILVPGDIMNGMYRHSRWEENQHGFEAQAREVAKVFPQLKGLTYHAILGNHDETFEKESGINAGSGLEYAFHEAGRSDFKCYGARGAYLRLKAPGDKRGCLVELWHPIKGGSYALSYPLQKHVESYGVGQKPDMLFAGHWHQQCYFTTRGVHAFSSGTFHGGGGSFGKALGGVQAIGGWSVEYKQTAHGTVREIAPRWHAYHEREEVRSVHLG